MRKKLFVTLIGFIFLTRIFAQVDLKIASIDSMINIYTDYYGFCGTVLIEKSGEIILNKGYGYASYELNVPCTDSTKYHICSITKGFARVLIDGLVNEGKLNLNDKLIKYLPEIGEEKGNKILIKHLIIHQSGLQENFFDPISRNTRLDNIRSIKDTELQFEPGTKEQYCNLNYYILGIIYERLTGYDIASAYQEEIFKPLGMNDSYLDNAERMLKNIAVPHYVNQVNQPDMFIHVYPKPNDKGFAAGGNIMPSEDLLKWIHGWHSNKFGLKVEDLENDVSHLYGKAYGKFSMGWETDGIKRKFAQGDGIGEGFRTMYIYFPEDSITILYMNNSYYFISTYHNWDMPLFDNIVYNSAKIMLDKDFSLPKLPIGQVLINDLNSGANVDDILSKYSKLKDKEDKYLFDAKQLNRLAYVYMEEDKFADAFKILQLNKMEYPDHWIPIDGMAEYYLRNGDKENAIKYLKISLEKNPNKWREQRKMNDIRRNNLETLDWKN